MCDLFLFRMLARFHYLRRADKRFSYSLGAVIVSPPGEDEESEYS